MPDDHEAADPALAALDDLCVAVRASIQDCEQILQRAETVKRQRAAGWPYAQIAPTEARPLIVELLSDSMSRLAEAGSRWRRQEARALHDEGLSMEKIAQLFGVTRQRVSALLQNGSSRRPR